MIRLTLVLGVLILIGMIVLGQDYTAPERAASVQKKKTKLRLNREIDPVFAEILNPPTPAPVAYGKPPEKTVNFPQISTDQPVEVVEEPPIEGLIPGREGEFGLAAGLAIGLTPGQTLEIATTADARTIISARINIRRGPSEIDPIMGSLRQGDPVRLMSVVRGDWALIRFGDDQQMGYLPISALSAPQVP